MNEKDGLDHLKKVHAKYLPNIVNDLAAPVSDATSTAAAPPTATNGADEEADDVTTAAS